MDKYDFATKEFAISEEGIHMLRSGFNYKTISFQQIDKVIIKMDFLTKRVFLTWLVGLASIIFAFMQVKNVYECLVDPAVKVVLIEFVVLPFLPTMLGIYCIYISVKKVPTLLIICGSILRFGFDVLVSK